MAASALAASKKWRVAIDKAITTAKRAKFVKSEWREFSNEKIAALQSVYAASEREEVAGILTSTNSVSKLIREDDPDFVAHLLIAAFEGRLSLGSKFDQVFAFVEARLQEDFNWTKVFQLLFKEAVEIESPSVLTDLLSLGHDDLSSRRSKPRLTKSPVHPNNPALLLACKKNNYELVRPLVERGYRMRTMHLSSRRREHMDSWAKYIQIPFLFESDPGHENDGNNPHNRLDEITELEILRLMSKPAYINACYTAVAENYDWERNEWCECAVPNLKGHHIRRNKSSDNNGNDDGAASSSEGSSPVRQGLRSDHSKVTLHTMLQYEVEEEDFHHCPSYPTFVPDPNCGQHIECNDPVFRCFDIARLSSEYAKEIPEHRAEYGEIADACRSLSVKLLSECTNSNEVCTLLEEDSGAIKYFKYARYMKFPRLRMAIEHNHKEFAAHMYCQQLLRKLWHGDVRWQGKHNLYKIVYFVFENILSPFHCIVFSYVETGRNIVKMREEKKKPQYPVYENKTRLNSLYVKYLRYCNEEARINLDAPLNRFLCYTGSYLFYVVLLMITVTRPAASKVSGGSNDGFEWCHIVLAFFAMGMVLKDIETLIVLSSIRTFLKFWRAYSVVSHALISLALLLRYYMIVAYPCQRDQVNNVIVCPEEYVDKRETLDLVSSGLFAVSCNLGICKLCYWLQLSDKVGPVIINISRVFLDILTMVSTFTIVIVSFSFTVTYILSIDIYVADSIHLDNQTNVSLILDRAEEAEEYLLDLGEMFGNLFWGFFEPGYPQFITTSGVRAEMGNLPQLEKLLFNSPNS